MPSHVRVQIESGKKKRVVASAFDWPGWDRWAKTEDDAVAVLERYRPRYAKVAELAGYGDTFAESGPLEVFARVPGIGMTDFYGTPCVAALPEYDQMTPDECERKTALLRACWAYFDAVAERVQELSLGPRGGGRDRDKIVRHANGAEIFEWAPKVGVKVPLETREDPEALRTYRVQLIDAIREHNAAGEPARSWTLQFLIRRACYHMLDHAWEMEDRDLTA
jgi:hypothetical protein